MNIWTWIGGWAMWIGGIALFGCLTQRAVRRWAPDWEDPAMYACVFLVGLAIYLVARFL